MKRKRVSIILVTFNSEETIEELLGSIGAVDVTDLELIVVDNGSRDGTTEIIENRIENLRKKIDVKLIRLHRNMGLYYSANIAVEESSGEFLCVIDHDIVFTPPVIGELVKNLKEDSNLGAVQPKVINAFNKKLIDSDDINEDGSIRGMQASYYQKSRKILYPMGACFLTNRKIYNTLLGFDNDFFVERGDIDFGWRLWLFGFYVKTVPRVKIYHKRGTLGGQKKIRTVLRYHRIKNDMLMLIQNLEAKNLVIYFPTRIFYTFFILIFGKPADRRLTLLAAIWIIKNLKHIMAKRKFIQHSRKIKDDAIMGMLQYILPPSLATRAHARLFRVLARK